jgi:hypothetical protein
VPRVIRIEYDSRSGHCTAHQKKPPTGLRVSREETLSEYRLAFGTAQVFINLNAGVLRMDNGTSNQGLRLELTTCLRELLRHASHDDIRSIRSLAISCTEGALIPLAAAGHRMIHLIPSSYWDSHGIYFELSKFPNLKRLIYKFSIPPETGDYRGRDSTYDRIHQYKKARTQLIPPDGYSQDSCHPENEG